MSCKHIKSELVHFIYGEVTPEMNNTIKEHLSVCTDCKDEYDSLSGTRLMLDNWKNISPSEEFETVLNNSIKDCVPEKVNYREEIKYACLSMLKTLSPAICGILVTTCMVLLMSANVQINHLNPVSLILCGIFWGGIYSMVFDLAIKNGSYGDKIHMRELLGLNLKISVYAAFLSLFIGAVLILLSPLSGTGISCIQEFIYSFTPLLTGSYLIGRKVNHNHILHGIFLSILYILMIGPAIYIQCINFEFSVYVLFIAISSLGAITGGMTGAWFSGKFVPRPVRKTI